MTPFHESVSDLPMTSKWLEGLILRGHASDLICDPLGHGFYPLLQIRKYQIIEWRREGREWEEVRAETSLKPASDRKPFPRRCYHLLDNTAQSWSSTNTKHLLLPGIKVSCMQIVMIPIMTYDAWTTSSDGSDKLEIWQGSAWQMLQLQVHPQDYPGGSWQGQGLGAFTSFPPSFLGCLSPSLRELVILFFLKKGSVPKNSSKRTECCLEAPHLPEPTRVAQLAVRGKEEGSCGVSALAPVVGTRVVSLLVTHDSDREVYIQVNTERYACKRWGLVAKQGLSRWPGHARNSIQIGSGE